MLFYLLLLIKMKEQDNNLVSVCLDNEGFNSKPSNPTPAKIVLRIATCSTQVTIKNLAKEITMPDARSWTPATFKESYNQYGKRGLWKNTEGWNGQQLFPIDIDSDKDGKPKIFFKEAIQRCERLKLIPVFAYSTFSETETNTNGCYNFRLVFMLPEKIDDLQIRNLIQTSLGKIFTERDTSCDDRSKLFYGGKKLIYENYEARIDIHELVHAVGIYLKEKDSTNYAKNYTRYCNDAGLFSIKNTPDIKVEEIQFNDSLIESTNNFPSYREESTNSCNKLYIYYRLSHKILQKYTISIKAENNLTYFKAKKAKKIKSSVTLTPERTNLSIVDFAEIEAKCRLYKEYVTGKHWAYHQELRGLATNLINIRGGEKKFFEGINSRVEYGYKVNDFKYYVNYFKHQNYLPERCESFCPFHEECQHHKNIITTVKTFKNEVTVIKRIDTISLQEVEMKFKEAMDRALSSEDKDIYVIKVSTGFGKTEFILSIENAIIAVPTNELKEEISVRMTKQNIEHLTTPKMPEIQNVQIKEKIESLYQIGAYSSAALLLRNMTGRNKCPEAEKYLKDLDSACKSDKTVVTTHERFLYFKNSILNTLIVDEDPLPTLLKIDDVNINDLQFFLSFIQKEDFDNNAIAKDIYDTISTTPINKFCTMNSYNWVDINKNESKYATWLLEQNINSNVLGFLYCSHFIKVKVNEKEKIYFIKKRELPDKKIIILSATANETIYKNLYGDRVKFIDIGAIEMKGKLIQYPEYSFSRYSLREDESRLILAQGLAKDKDVITFKKYKDKFGKVAGTFGSLLGIDTLSGKDLTIIGTPHILQTAYGLYALALGHDITFSDMKMEYCLIDNEWFRFYFETFSENSLLQELQFHFIESELVQAIGRARLLRNDCTVTLYSNYPIPGAEFRYLTKEEKDEIINLKNVLITDNECLAC